jgi:hypothetical protein
MKRLHRSALILLIAIAAAATAAARAGNHRTSSVTEGLSARIRGPQVQWIFYPKDLLSCSTPAFVLRHLHAELGRGVPVVAYGIDIERSDAQSFLRSERLNLELVTGSARSYRGLYKKTPVSGLYLVVGDSIISKIQPRDGSGYPSVQAIRARLESLTSPAEISGRIAPSPTPAWRT